MTRVEVCCGVGGTGKTTTAAALGVAHAHAGARTVVLTIDPARRLADALGLDHVHVGTVSSAGHKSPKWGDPTGNYGGKFKSILSRTPLTGGMDISVEGSGGDQHRPSRCEG